MSNSLTNPSELYEIAMPNMRGVRVPNISVWGCSGCEKSVETWQALESSELIGIMKASDDIEAIQIVAWRFVML